MNLKKVFFILICLFSTNLLSANIRVVDLDIIIDNNNELNNFIIDIKNDQIQHREKFSKIELNLKNREDQIIGLTCRVGRSIIGSTNKIRDILLHDKSILILGKPGSGKTTIIREIARIFSNELEKRVVIVDTSNEIAGDNDVPHVAVGRARRLQVKKFDLQHQVLIEAVENHMPEVIIIDEISTETETLSARTIAERGVQLIATAHGNSLVNLVKNPILVNLIGGIQSVTLSDQSAKLRNTKKSVLERQFAATFDVIIEISSSDSWIIYDKVEEAVDLILNGENTNGQARLDLMTHLEINYP